MTDRWNPKVVETPQEHPVKVFVPGGEPSGLSGELTSQHRVTMHPAGFRVRERGALGSKVVHSYVCPEHGAVDASVPRDDVPDEVVCGSITGIFCGRTATWAGSLCGQGHASGEVTS